MNTLNASRKARRPLRRVATGLAAIAVAVTLASCGGSSSDNGIPTPTPVVSNTPPASASQSVDGFIAFLKTLVPTRPETTEPLDVASFVAPTTETGDPDPSI